MKFSHTLSLLTGLLIDSVAAGSYSNPLRTSAGGDPTIVYHDGFYYFMSTNFANLQMTRATTLEGLKNGETKQVWYETDPNRNSNIWAPEMHLVDGKWQIFYSGGPASGPQHSLVLQGGATPWDEYSFFTSLRPDDEWAIDGTPIEINGQRYFVYSGFEPDVPDRARKQCLYITPYTSATTTGDKALLSFPEEEWETQGEIHVNEGAFGFQRNNKTMITFSGSFCHTQFYALGLLTYLGGDPMDRTNWEKTGPHFSSANGQFGTGHNSFFTSPDGTETYNTYHFVTNPQGSCGNDRQAATQLVNWNADGSPDFGTPEPLGTVSDGPSGEPL
ncbi:Putative glycoside hydrolase, family 43 [Septoria linicola]|uniref:Glycoside hydrolase, family 43 n=1 Tax=Septoria linicola TaxID=215465 RepID=A0A9Q9AMQ5_9PEZI|nr:putative glycoside hydrolase, family 43 [Septoria linicola]USW48786.1 Putative glycoside hydrolase, family 43 [Septoria linicola]